MMLTVLSVITSTFIKTVYLLYVNCILCGDNDGLLIRRLPCYQKYACSTPLSFPGKSLKETFNLQLRRFINQHPGLLICKYQAGQKWPGPHYVGGPLTNNLR